MQVYSIYVKYYRLNAELLPTVIPITDKISIYSIVFNIFWALYHKMWTIFALGLLVWISMHSISYTMFESSQTMNFMISLSFMLFFGLFSTELREYDLLKKGYSLESILLATSTIDAEIKFLYNNYAQRKQDSKA